MTTLANIIQEQAKKAAAFKRFSILHNSPKVYRDEAEKVRVANQYLISKHPAIVQRMRRAGGLNGLGDFWSNLRDKLIGTAKEDVQQAATNATQAAQDAVQAKIDSLKTGLQNAVNSGNAGQASSIMDSLKGLMAPESIVALYNTYRIKNGQEPLSTADVLGVGKESDALKWAAYAAGGAAILFALSKFVKR